MAFKQSSLFTKDKINIKVNKKGKHKQVIGSE